MEYESKVQWLFRFRDSLREQKALELEAERMQAYAEHIGHSPSFAGRPGGRSTESRLPDAVDRLIQAHDALRAEINRCLVVRAEIRAVIQTVPDQRQRDILRRRYILGQTIEAIAAELYLAPRHVQRLHKSAVLALDIPEPDSPDGGHFVDIDAAGGTGQAAAGSKP